MLIHRRIRTFTLIFAALSLAACANARVGDGEDGVGATPDAGGGGGVGDQDGGAAAESPPTRTRRRTDLTPRRRTSA